MMTRVEEEQKNKLESVAALQEEQRTALGHLSLEAKSTGAGTGGGAGAATSTTSSSSAAAVSEQIDALFAQLSTSDAGSKQSTPALTASRQPQRIDTAPSVVPVSAGANVVQPLKPSPSSSSIMSLRPTTAPTQWNGSNVNGTAIKDPVSSMMMSNLTNLSASSAQPSRPNLQWGNTTAMTSTPIPQSGPNFPPPAWSSATPAVAPYQQPMMMASPMLPQSFPQLQPLQPPFGQPNVQAVRPLARADIDDLLG